MSLTKRQIKLRKDHIIAMRIHAKRRGIQRIGFDLTRTERREIAGNIKIFPVIENQGSADVRYGFWKGKEILFVYEAGIRTIVTVLPLDHRLIEKAREIYQDRCGFKFQKKYVDGVMVPLTQLEILTRLKLANDVAAAFKEKQDEEEKKKFYDALKAWDMQKQVDEGSILPDGSTPQAED